MENYKDVINRIEEILNLSKSTSNTKRICFFDIDETYYEEFDNLIKTELVYFELEKNVNKYINNNIALKFEADKIKNQNNSKAVEELINIIDSTTKLNPMDLEIVGNYIVKRELSKDFHILTKQLHIGPYMPLHVMKDKGVDKLKNLVNGQKNQFHRINRCLSEKKEMPENNKEIIDGNEKSIVYLVNNGSINKEQLLNLSQDLNNIEYINLLYSLKKYLVITDEEFNEYYSMRSGKIIYANSVDQLIDFFKEQKDISISGLMSLEKYIGKNELDKLVFGLVQEGSIAVSDYLENYLSIDKKDVL